MIKGLVLDLSTANTRRYVVFIISPNQNLADSLTLNLEGPDSYASRDPKRTSTRIMPPICLFLLHYSSSTHLYDTCRSCSSPSLNIYLLHTCFHAHAVIGCQFLSVTDFRLLHVSLTRTLYDPTTVVEKVSFPARLG